MQTKMLIAATCLPAGILFLVVGSANLFKTDNSIAKPTNQKLRGQTFNFGSAFVGDVVDHTFTVFNSLERPLNITNVSTSCGCTVPGALPERVQPMSSFSVPVTIRLDKAVQQFSQSVTLSFKENDPVVFKVKGQVQHEIPKSIEFGSLLRGESSTIEFLLRSRTGKKVKIEKMVADERFFSLEDRSHSTQDANATIAVTLSGSMPEGHFEKTISIITGDSSNSEKIVKVRGYILRKVEVFPRSPITVGAIEPEGESSVTIRVFSPYGKPVHVQRIEFDNEQLLDASVNQEEDTQNKSSVNIVLTVLGRFEPKVMKFPISIYAEVEGTTHVIPIILYAMRKYQTAEVITGGVG